MANDNELNKKMPNSISIMAKAEAVEMTVEAAVEGQPKKRRFSMTAYNGGLMRVGGFWYPVVVDLKGMSMQQKKKPIFLQHNSHDINMLLGQTDTISVENNSLMASGDIFPTSENSSKEVCRAIELNDAGYKWQASIGASVDQYFFVKEKETVQVNGKIFNGPCYCISKSSLGEISFVMLGADESTSARIAAEQIKESLKMANETETKVEATTSEVETETPKTVVAETQTPQINAKSEAEKAVAEMRAAAATERTRIAEIGKVCAGMNAEIEAKAVAEGWTPEKTELEVLRASRPKAPNGFVKDSNITPKMLEAATIMAAGVDGNDLLKKYGEECVQAADNRFKGRIGLQQLIMEAARSNGCSVPYFRDDMRKVMQAAFSTTDLSGILGNTANKFLVDGFMGIERSFEKISSSRPVNDFKAITGYRLNGAFEFAKVGPDGELKHGTTSEDTFTNQAATYGLMHSITRQDLINDDLGALTDVPKRIGRGGALKLNSVFWTEFLDNSTFFASGNSNYASGAGTALSHSNGIDALTAANLLFLNQTDSDSKPLGVEPKILLVPNALFVIAKQLMSSLLIGADDEGPTDNPFAGMFEVVKSSYLANSSITGYSAAAWYLLANPSDLPTIEVVYLNGVKQPTVESADADFNTLGIQLRGYFDFGVTKQEYRGGVKMKGSA